MADNKQYDGNTNATVNFTGASLMGVVSGDTVRINSSGYTCELCHEDRGNGKPVTVTGVTLGGGDAGNYTVSQPTGLTADITAKNLTINGAVGGQQAVRRQHRCDGKLYGCVAGRGGQRRHGKDQLLWLQCELRHARL